MALIDIDYFRRQPLGLKGDIPSEVLTEVIQEASEYIEDYLDRKILSTSYTERIIGKGEYTMILDNFPITAISDIVYTGLWNDMGTISSGEFLIHAGSGIIEWIDKRNYFRADRVYQVSYVAGWSEVPGPVKRAVALQAVQLLRPMYGGPQQETPDIVPFADEMIVNLLERYRRKRLS